jgi:MFS family permease
MMAVTETSLGGDQATDLSMSSAEKNFGDENLMSPQPEAPPRNMGNFKWILICSALYSATLLYGLDTTIVADVQVPIVQRFGQIEKMTWIGAAFPLGSVAIILPLGVMYESFDSKWLYLVSFTLFEAGSALCGGAPNMNALIIGRVIAGIGGSGLYLG